MNNKIIIKDNASIHKNKVMRDLVEEIGHQLIFYHPISQNSIPLRKFVLCGKAKSDVKIVEQKQIY